MADNDAERDAQSAQSAPQRRPFTTQEQWDAHMRRHSNPQSERETTLLMRRQQQQQPQQHIRQPHDPRGFDIARMQSFVPPEMRRGAPTLAGLTANDVVIHSSPSDASTLTPSQRSGTSSTNSDNIALLQQPSQLEDEEEAEDGPRLPGKGPCQLLHGESNCKKTLMAMLIGLESADGRKLGDAFQTPYFEMKQRAQFVINNEHLQKETVRRAQVTDMKPKPKPTWWNKGRCMEFLNKYPINNPVDKAWLLKTEAAIAEALKADKAERAELQLEQQEKASAKWTDVHPWLRLHVCMCDDRARAALRTRDKAWDRSALDARNSEERPADWYEVVANLYNDPDAVFTTEALPFLHVVFREQIDLHFEDMPGGSIDREDVRKRHADARSSLISVS